MGHASRSWGRQAALIVAVLAMLAALLPVAAAHAAAGSKSADGEIFVVAINAKQRDLDSARMDGLVDRLVNHTAHAPDAIFVSEIVHTNLLDLRDRLNVAMPDDVAHYVTAGITTNGQLEGAFEGSNIKVKILVNSKTVKVGRNVQWHDKCTTTRTYQLITGQKIHGDGTVSPREVALAGVHFAPSFNEGGSVECKEQNAAEARRQMAAHADSGIMGDFNRRATTEYYECNPEEEGALEPWYQTMTGPSNIDGRLYRDTVRVANFRTTAMPDQWSFESEATEPLCNGVTTHKRSRLDYIFVSDEMTPKSAGTDQGWGGGAPGDPACSTTGCKYSDHRFVWARVGISAHAATPSRPSNLAVAEPSAPSELRLSWDASTGANGYDVYRYDADDAVRSWVHVGSSTTAAYTDTDTALQEGATYHYRVVATAGADYSRPSLLASGTTASPAPNAAPVATITTPASGTHVEPNSAGTATLSLAATASDADRDALTYEWSAPKVAFATPAALDTEATLPTGEHTLTFAASDGKTTTTDTVEVLVKTNSAPEVTITTPENESITVTADSTGTAHVDLAAEASDEPGTLTWAWSTTSPSGVSFSPVAGASTTATLAVGTHKLTSSATDGFKATGSDFVNVTVEKAPSYTEATTSGETAVAGTVSGTHAATHTAGGAAQTITEVSSGGKPAARHNFLEHRWSVDVPSGDSVTVRVDAATTAADDSFRFAYSTDNGATYTDLLTVTPSTSAAQEASLTGFTGGPLLLRVVDTNRPRGESSTDSIAVDHIVVLSHRSDAPPAAPEPAAATATTDTAVRITWADVVGEDAYAVEFTTDPATETSWASVGATTANVTEIMHSGLQTGTKYYYRVQATNGFGASDWTAPASATPTTAPATRPMTVTVSGSSTSKPKGMWMATATANAVDDTGAPVAAARVSFRWDNGTTGTCTTDDAGVCAASLDASKQQSAVTYTVTGATTPPASSLTYTLPDPPPSVTVVKP